LLAHKAPSQRHIQVQPNKKVASWFFVIHCVRQKPIDHPINIVISNPQSFGDRRGTSATAASGKYNLQPSPWLLNFAMFFFYSLSMAKRHVEIVRADLADTTGLIKGRGSLHKNRTKPRRQHAA
jgi:hypothetical protein